MKNSKTYKLLFSALLTTLFLASCSDDGAFEEAGEELDQATSNAQDALEDAGDETADRLEDACEELSEEDC